MAVLFSRKTADSLVEVRSAGRTRRLYVDGVLHTQYNPAVPLTGDYWDPVALSALLRPAAETRRALVLGVGGGAALHLLSRFVAPDTMVGIELDALHLELAERFFGLEPQIEGLQLVRAEAARWLRDYRGARFDLVVDDLYSQEDGEPVRAISVDDRWLRALIRPLSSHGILTLNLPDQQALRSLLRRLGPALRRRFGSAFRFASPQAENAIVAFAPRGASRRAMRHRLRTHRAMASRRARALARFRGYDLW